MSHQESKYIEKKKRLRPIAFREEDEKKETYRNVLYVKRKCTDIAIFKTSNQQRPIV